MTMEIPEFKRCCFCLPLRAGLLAWSYIKVVANTFIIPILAYFILCNIVLSLYAGNKKYVPLILLYAFLGLTVLIMLITDYVATIVFIVAGHKKNAKMIRGYYVYNIVVLIVTALLIVAAVGISIVNWRDTTLNLLLFAGYLLTLIVQAYFILLLRSEFIKLKSQGEFRFVNNSPEAQCIMTKKDKEAEMQDV